MTFEERYKDHSDFVDHFQAVTKGSTNLQFSNWVDNWCWRNGYRISFAGGLVPERFWSKPGCKDIVVRSTEVNLCGMPVNEDDLLSPRFNIYG
jgi:hypothetical protein